MIPLFKDTKSDLRATEKNAIPQIPLDELLKKYDGETYHFVDSKLQLNKSENGAESTLKHETIKKKYTIKKLPNHLILHMKRFTKNDFFIEKNPTIINFPIDDLMIHDCKYELQMNVIHEGKGYK